MSKNGIIAEVAMTIEKAADGKHPPVIEMVNLPTSHDAIPCGEVLFESENGPVPLANARVLEKATSAFDGTATDATVNFGVPIVPGSVLIVTNDTTPKAITDNGDGTLGADADDGDGTVDYTSGVVALSFDTAPANTKIATVTTVPTSAFVGVSNESYSQEDDVANVVIHGTLVSDIAKINGKTINEAQYKMLKSRGIF